MPEMSKRIFNFSAGPAMLPTEALEKSAAALVDYQGKGFGIAEVSHRGKEFDAVVDEAIVRCKQLLGLRDAHDVLFLHGGGEGSKKAVSFGKEIGRINVVAPTEASNFDHSTPASEWKMSSDADYFH